MSSEITVYRESDFGEVRTVVIDGRTWFVATDIARNLAYRDAAAMTRLLPEDEKGYTSLCTPGGEQRVSVLSEAGLYRACMTRTTTYIKDPATRERVERFQHWILHEVLPGLRDTGYYLNVPPEKLAPEDLDRLTAYTMAGLAARNAALQAENDAMRPKAALGEAVSAATNCIDVTGLSRILHQNGVDWGGRDRTYEHLRDDGYLMNGGVRHNLPYQRWMEQGLFEVQEVPYRAPDGSMRVRLKTMVTSKGVEHLLKRYAPNCALPGMEGVGVE